MNKLYIGNSGLISLASTLTGRENIYIGIRPRGIHAGNKIPLIIYPYLLCKLLEYRKIKPRFTINYFINDYEQYTLEGSDKKQYPFNIVPLGKTLQFEPYNDKLSMSEYWAPQIQKEVESTLGSEFKELKLKFIKNSELKNEPVFKEVVIKTIKEPYMCRNILYKYSHKQVRVNPTSYCMVVCNKCKFPTPNIKTFDDSFFHYKCSNADCGFEETQDYGNLDYWLYHKPLAIPRIKIRNIDLCITGMDHFNEGDFITREKLFEFYGVKIKPFRTLYTPILLGDDGSIKMSKSKDNYFDMEFNDLLNLVKSSPTQIIVNENYAKK